MPSQATIADDDRVKIKAVVPTKIFSAALARIYYTYPQPNKWCYTGLQGALVFTFDKFDGAFHFKMVDLEGTRGILWEHELYQNLEYNVENSFFHSFEGDDCMIGFIFANESEAGSFSQKVISNKDSNTKPQSEKKKKKGAKGGKIDKSMISSPQTGSFVHIAHMGYDDNDGFTSKGVDPSWTHFIHGLENRGINPKIIAKEQEFIQRFARDYQAEKDKARDFQTEEVKKSKPPAPPPPARRTYATNALSPAQRIPPPPPPARTQNAARVQTPPPVRPQNTGPPRAQNTEPPPPPPVRPLKTGPPLPKRGPPKNTEVLSSPQTTTPPPVLPRRPASQSKQPPPPPARPSSTLSGPSALSTRPPPPPMRPTLTSGSVRPPPPPRPTSTAPPPTSAPPAPPPPPPPPPPPLTGAPPHLQAPTFEVPPPPPPPPSVGDAPPSVKAILPPPQPGRSDLLASIQGKGIHSLKKVDPNVSPSRVPSVSADSSSLGSTAAVASPGGAAAGAGGDLTSALAAALLERNKRLGDSDDDDDDDDDEDDWD